MITANYLITHIRDYNILFQELDIDINTRTIILLKGELGVGKTTFIKQFLITQFDYHEATSPTFGIINTYNVDNINFYHYDLYRINNATELDEIGLYNNLDLDGVHFIEWPEIIPEKLIKPNIVISFQVVDQQRLISIIFNNE